VRRSAKYSSILNSFDVSREQVKSMFIDDTEINVEGKKDAICVAVVKTRTINVAG
jgi:hypothetical protein